MKKLLVITILSFLLVGFTTNIQTTAKDSHSKNDSDHSEKYAYLQSTNLINWKENESTKELAKKLTEDADSHNEKLYEVYNYIVKNISYDREKLHYIKENINGLYTPNMDQILKDGRGICYDYSVLFAGMLRSVGIPTKLIKGYREGLDDYHSWNEVYIKEKDRWVIIDTTYDAVKTQEEDKSVHKFKADEKYQKEKNDNSLLSIFNSITKMLNHG
ncbi:transglutaminase-like domain-containing protein [Natranaerofaba carboxydovora]|uniref:transglutaminase-like domain-containing protein n=1 Tax=Natranaerofaba carboxydovora TaxID=2742683 RepID=UPI001F12C754|nr:transglutaminase-like domain-containing protein [Natranaerofaba carboxydovora]UMZ72922.1 Transglutaminase-like superfamily protein [Natranaerofaba carboxydovora]